MAAKVGYPIELVRMQRFCHEDKDEFLLVDIMDEQVLPRNITTKPMGEWTWEFYERAHGKEAVAAFRRAVDDIEKLVKRRNWSLPYNLNKYYTGFKLGGTKLVFAVVWAGTHSWNVVAKVTENEAKTFQGKNWDFQRYDTTFRQAIFRPRARNDPEIGELESILTLAYSRISGP
jgi:hypothetical protein